MRVTFVFRIPTASVRASGLLNEAALVELVEATREATLSARNDGDRLLMVGGDCPVMLGALAALRDHSAARVGLLMLDGHEDGWLPAQSPTGEASDSELAIALGLVSDGLPAPLDQLVPLLEPADVALIGPRDRGEIDAERGRSLRDHVGLFLSAEETARAEDPGAAALRELEVSGFWLHVDLDVLATDAFGRGGLPAAWGTHVERARRDCRHRDRRPPLQGRERGHLQPRARPGSSGRRSRRRVRVPADGSGLGSSTSTSGEDA